MKDTVSKIVQDLYVRIVEYTQFSQISYLMIIGGFTGILGGFGAIGVIYTIRFFQYLALQQHEHVLLALSSLPWFVKILIPTIGFSIVGFLVNKWAKEAKGHGVPEVMSAIALNNGVIRPIVVVIKAIASAITIATGGSVGREGPIVQIGSGIGSTIGQLLRLSPERLTILVGCGAAAGIAATFNAPIAGAFFALEVIIGNFALRAFSPIILSSVLATVVSRFFLGDHPSFALTKIYMLVSVWEIPLYIILGVLTGAVSILFIQTLFQTEEWFDNLKLSPYLKATFGGLLVGIIIIFVPNIYGTGHETIESILNLTIHAESVPKIAQLGFLKYFYHGAHLGYLIVGFILLLFAKLLATNITLSSGGSGGIFAPSLFLGATCGAIYGIIVNYLFPTVTAPIGAYAIVGMGAVVAGTTHAPITAGLILFELTNDYKIILPMMITCTISTLMSRGVNVDSIYTIKLTRRGISLNQSDEAMIMKSFRVSDVMKGNPPVIPETASFNALVHTFLNNQNPEYFIINEQRQLLGVVSLHHLKSVMYDENLKNLVLASDIMEETNQLVFPETSLAECMTQFAVSEQEHLPVIDNKQHRQLLGYISHGELINLYDREILKKNVAELKFVREGEEKRRKELIKLPEDYDLEYIRISDKHAGKSLAELNLRARFNITILTISRNEDNGNCRLEIPTADSVLAKNDLLFVVGKREDILKAFR